MKETIKLIRNNAAVDAAIITKDRALEGVSRYFGWPLEKIAMIGDEVTDLLLLTKQGLGLVGAPANAQKRVIETLKFLRNGFVSSLEVFDGFLDFYNVATKLGIQLVMSDKDGVLKDGDILYGQRFRELALEMGKNGKPYVVVLTGSSCEQNASFMEKYGLDERLSSNHRIIDYPWLLLVENGAIHINVLTREKRNYVKDISPELLKSLKGDFESEVRKRLDSEVLPEFSLGWSESYEDQKGRVYHAKEKLSMVTFNVPRAFSDGRPYRKSDEAERFRTRTMQVMEEVASRLDLPYQIL